MKNALLIVAALAACSPPGGDATASVRDSAGIEIVENRAPVWSRDKAWTLSAEPILQIGTATGAREYELASVWGVYRLSNGDIVVGDQASAELRFFDRNGKFLRRAGGRGQGPGQFDGLIDVMLGRGDTVVAQSQIARLDYFTVKGDYSRTVHLVTPDSLQAVQTIIGLFDDGSILARTFPRLRNSAALVPAPDSAMMLRFAPDGSLRGIAGRFPAVLQVQKGERSAPAIFGPTAWAVTSGDLFYVGFPATYEIGVYHSDGRPERLIRRAWTPIPVSPGDIERYRDAWRAMRTAPSGQQLSSAELRDWMDRLDQAPIADTLPAHSIFFADRVGNLWVRHYELAGATYGLGLLPEGNEPAHASVFDPNGRWLGDVTIPPAFYIQDIGDDYLLGTATAADGVQYVRMYALTKGG